MSTRSYLLRFNLTSLPLCLLGKSVKQFLDPCSGATCTCRVFNLRLRTLQNSSFLNLFVIFYLIYPQFSAVHETQNEIVPPDSTSWRMSTWLFRNTVLSDLHNRSLTRSSSVFRNFVWHRDCENVEYHLKVYTCTVLTIWLYCAVLSLVWLGSARYSPVSLLPRLVTPPYVYYPLFDLIQCVCVCVCVCVFVVSVCVCLVFLYDTEITG